MSFLRRLPLELMLVIGIPLTTVVAGITTLVIAHQNSYSPMVEGRSDRLAGLSSAEETREQ
ncbi:MAG: hypothetical protein ACX94A_05315 [Algiphilus sp.]